MTESTPPPDLEDTGPDGARRSIWRLPADRENLENLLLHLFTEHWQDVVFGPCVQGAVFEIQADGPPRHTGYLDGYLTVDFGKWHLHLCIGEHKGDPGSPCPPDLARWRKCAKAELIHTETTKPTGGHPPESYALVLSNGKDEQMITFFFPNPWLNEKHRVMEVRNEEKMELWEKLLSKYKK